MPLEFLIIKIKEIEKRNLGKKLKKEKTKMPKIQCRYCSRDIEITDYEFALWCEGDLFLCEKCQEKLDKNIAQVRVVRGPFFNV